MYQVNGLSLTKIAGFVLVSSLALSTNLHAVSYQNDLGLAYANPADYGRVNRVEVIAGGNEVFLNLQYAGFLGPQYGYAQTKTSGFLPQGRFAYRINPKIVIGVDITQPIYSDFSFAQNSFVAPTATDTLLRNTDISPRFSYQATEALTLAAGLNINWMYAGALSFVVPPFGNLNNTGSSWNYGYDLGLTYAIRKGSILGLSYYSGFTQHAKGLSTWGPNISRDEIDITIPATTTLEFTQFLSEKWLINGNIRYVQWSHFKTLAIQSTALPFNPTIVAPQNYFDTFNYTLVTRYQVNEKFAGLLVGQYLPKSQNTEFRNIGLPPNDATILGLGVEYNISQGLSALLVYAYGFGHAPIDIATPAGRAIGKVDVTANVVNMRLKYSV